MAWDGPRCGCIGIVFGGVRPFMCRDGVDMKRFGGIVRPWFDKGVMGWCGLEWDSHRLFCLQVRGRPAWIGAEWNCQTAPCKRDKRDILWRVSTD